MTEIEKKALALANEVAKSEQQSLQTHRFFDVVEALCRLIEEHEAFKQEVSDAVAIYSPENRNPALGRFIIAKPDPLVEAWDYMVESGRCDSDALRAALAKRGLKIVEIER